ncbi:MAG: gamma-glutamylcyclotransferase [Bdellovibrionales bacterium]|nr:gamma-glutamylcyclotransferase [Bdellovibrionales bacterium]
MLNHALFVCGSLCQGMVHHKLLQDSILKVSPAVTQGNAYRLEVGYPVFSATGTNSIQGELIELKATEILWPLLDQFFSFSEDKLEKSLFHRKPIHVTTDSGVFEVFAYSINPTKMPKTAKLILDGDWRKDIKLTAPVTTELTVDEADYIKKLGKCTGREIVPYTPLTRELEKRGIVVDKGRRPALTKLGKEIFHYLG